jgi:hypothetical protein
MYIEAWVVVDGAHDEEQEFTTEEAFHDWHTRIVEQALKDKTPRVEIHYRDHPHEQGIECECHQYDTDHHPFITVNP